VTPGIAGAGGKACGKRRTRVRIRAKKGTRVRAVTVFVNGRKVKRVRGQRRAVRLKLAPRKSGKARVVVVVKAVRKGRTIRLRSRHNYRVCVRS
jgi:hypothetical protein